MRTRDQSICTTLAHLLAVDGPARRLWHTLPTNAFVRLDRTHTFRRGHPLVVMKTRELLDHHAPIENEVGPFLFCRVSVITCGGVPCAYAITAPTCRMRVRATYCTWSRSGTPVRACAPLYVDGTLGLVGDEHAIVAFVHRRQWIG